MTGIDGATAARPTDRDLLTGSGFDGPPFDLLLPLSDEFFVEWQVAGRDTRARLTTGAEK